ncbi:MAG: response regulator [Mariniblastus sp.]
MKPPLTFLLVEDDDTHAHLITRSLAKSEIDNRVFRVNDGAKAIQWLQQAGESSDQPRPDVVLLDLKLPKLDGHEVLMEIKSDPGLRKIPIVVMSTSNSEVDRNKAYENHANSYVVKPTDFAQFRKLINDICVYWGVWNQLSEQE